VRLCYLFVFFLCISKFISRLPLFSVQQPSSLPSRVHSSPFLVLSASLHCLDNISARKLHCERPGRVRNHNPRRLHLQLLYKTPADPVLVSGKWFILGCLHGDLRVEWYLRAGRVVCMPLGDGPFFFFTHPWDRPLLCCLTEYTPLRSHCFPLHTHSWLYSLTLSPFPRSFFLFLFLYVCVCVVVFSMQKSTLLSLINWGAVD